ncbi:50S ribosomal protein L23 [Candidatus Woesearchaeota archaeon]|nr:MAG: 50S ribosomal protein L23 [Candidatus Woesearchaeota archaeon]
MIIKHPVSTEKSIKAIESENKLIFIVDPKADKHAIKRELEALFKAKVATINTIITPGAQKRAIVRFAPETPAIDIATKLGLM